MPRGGAVVGAAEAGQPFGAQGQGAQGVGAALILGPRIGGAHRRSERVQPGVDGFGVGGEQGGEHGGQPAAVFDRDVDGSAAGRGLGAAHRVRVELGDERVDGLFGLVHRHRLPGPQRRSQCAVHRAESLGVDDQGAAGDDGPHQGVADQPVGEHGGHLREAVPQRGADEQQAGRGAGGDAVRRHRCGRRPRPSCPGTTDHDPRSPTAA